MHMAAVRKRQLYGDLDILCAKGISIAGDDERLTCGTGFWLVLKLIASACWPVNGCLGDRSCSRFSGGQ